VPQLIAARLKDREAITKARALPYQLMVAYTMTEKDVPAVVREALQDALEIALENVPALDGQLYVCPDVSGSMASAVTGLRKGATSAVRCIDVAALIAAAVLRKNAHAEVIPFEQTVVPLALNPRDSVMTNAQKLAQIGGGGTNCSAPLELLNRRKATGDLVIYVSDNQSWVDASAHGQPTGLLTQWAHFKARNPAAKLVCIDLQPLGTTQAAERVDVLNVGGFSDTVFEILTEFAAGRLNAEHWVGVIEKMTL
jgi:60 kDa SS-A/Ro ribonucleoprotein